MTDDTALQTRIASLLYNRLNVEVSSVHADLIESGLLDSLKIVELLMELECHFSVRVPFEALELESFRSVASIARLTAALCVAAAVAETAAASASAVPLALPVTD